MFATITLLAALAGFPVAPAPVLTAAVTVVQAQAEQPQAEEEFDILHHIQDAHEIELPGGRVWHLPEAGSWMVGPVDMTPTKHVVFLGLTALIVLALLLPAGAGAARMEPSGAPRKGHNVIEATILFLRDQIVMPNVGHGGERYAPFIITLFFFILIANLLGLLPWGASATGNVSVTAALAVMTFVVVEYAGMRALGTGYLSTIFYWNKHLPLPIRVVLFLIMTPVELLGKLTKPFALAIRLFANMTAGHVLLLAIISLIFLFGSFFIAVAPVAMAIALTFMELFVGFLQAYIFALLASVFIGLIVHAH
jgi:F-type H+-transporting ATPase subunit a